MPVLPISDWQVGGAQFRRPAIFEVKPLAMRHERLLRGYPTDSFLVGQSKNGRYSKNLIVAFFATSVIFSDRSIEGAKRWRSMIHCVLRQV